MPFGAEWAWGTRYPKRDTRPAHAIVAPRLEAAKTAILNGSLEIYRGPMNDNEGSIAIPAGKTLKIVDVELDEMNWLVEGVEGRAHG